MPNRLIDEKSPYLLQHAHNPVDWYPWCDDAFDKARAEEKPIFLSVGYATCHWCHVMERESFEDQDVAELLNEHFISIKVDREERPDVDRIYMTVCQALTGRGGWPLSIFMTPDKKPFYAGTYFPKTGRLGLPGFVDLLKQIAEVWRNHRAKALDMGEKITAAIQPKKESLSGATFEAVDLAVLQRGYEQLKALFDPQWGGFGSAPKFPTPHHLTFLLRWHRRNPESQALEMVRTTLDNMRDGGIYDHIGFGFARYSVDERWFAPHFEKMLYDQAMLAMAYIEAFQVTAEERYAEVAREIFSYVLRDMTDPEGGFYSAEDADSEGEEGLFYLWTPVQVREVLGQDLADVFCGFHNVTATGNFENGKSILYRSKSEQEFAQSVGMDVEDLRKALEEGRRKLFEARERRVHPLKDDKILTAWNGLMIAALAKGWQVLREKRWLHAAEKAATFILKVLRNDSGRLLRRYRHGEVAHAGYLDDYAFMIWGLIELYESTFKIEVLEEALRLNRLTLELFWDEEEGGFFYTAQDSEKQIIRDKDIYDGAMPSSNSVAALNLLRLGRMTGNTELEEKNARLFQGFAELVSDYPSAYTHYLNALDFALGPSREIVIAGKRELQLAKDMMEIVHKSFFPNRVLLFVEPGGEGEKLSDIAPFTQHLTPINGHPTVYICENYACRTPITEMEELKAALG